MRSAWTSRATRRTSDQVTPARGRGELPLVADGVGVEFDAAEVHDPGETGGVDDDEFFGGAAGGKGEGDGAEEGGVVGGSAFLEEGFGFGSVDEAL